MRWTNRLIVWFFICGASAAPSFVFGSMAYEEPAHLLAMFAGVMTFVLGYAWVTGTKWFAGLRRRAFVGRTLMIGYGTRLFLSLAFPIGMYVDIFCGMLSITLVLGSVRESAEPAQVYLITIVQGTTLNVLLAIYMALVWGVQRLFMKPPARPGFCAKCGYDLRASRDACPECGTAIEPEVLDLEERGL